LLECFEDRQQIKLFFTSFSFTFACFFSRRSSTVRFICILLLVLLFFLQFTFYWAHFKTNFNRKLFSSITTIKTLNTFNYLSYLDKFNFKFFSSFFMLFWKKWNVLFEGWRWEQVLGLIELHFIKQKCNWSHFNSTNSL
jgi:hypothetical protein